MVPGSIPSATAWQPRQPRAGFVLGTPGRWYAPGYSPGPDVPAGAVPGSIPSSTAWNWEVPAADEGPGWTTWGERFGNPAEGGAADVPGGGRSTTTGGRWANNAPAGVDQKWWDDFTEEHDGQNPLDYYGAQGEGLAEAMGDLEWSQGFERDHGRPPNDDEWRWWWFEKRGLNRPRQPAAPKEEEEPRPPLWIPPQVVWRQS